MIKSQTHIDADANKKSNPISTLELEKKSEEALKKPKEHNPFAPGDFVEKCILNLFEFSSHCRAIKN